MSVRFCSASDEDEGERVNISTRANESKLPAIKSLIGERELFLRFVERRIGDRAVAEDLLQSAYVRAIDQVESLRNEESVRAWFYRLLRNAVIDFYRHRAVEERVIRPMADGFDAPAQVVEERKICRCMVRAVDCLKPEYADVLRAVELTDSDAGAVEAYAHRVGITPGNAAVRAYRARKALVKSIQHTCGSCAGAGCLDCTCMEPARHHQG